MWKWNVLTVAAMTVSLAGCGGGPKSSRGFTLPDGNAERGEAVFIQLRCHECHTVSGVRLPEIDDVAQMQVRIGGEVSRIQTYGELVTSIINPSHKLASGYRKDDIANAGVSKMTSYNDVMTITELIDVVAFLQSRYKLRPHDPTDYPLYH